MRRKARPQSSLIAVFYSQVMHMLLLYDVCVCVCVYVCVMIMLLLYDVCVCVGVSDVCVSVVSVCVCGVFCLRLMNAHLV